MWKTIALFSLRYGTFLAVFGVFGITFLALKWALPLLWRTGPRPDKVPDIPWRPKPPKFARFCPSDPTGHATPAE